MRVPTINETKSGTSGTNGVPNCSSGGSSWSSTCTNSYNCYAWSGTSKSYNNSTALKAVICVK